MSGPSEAKLPRVSIGLAVYNGDRYLAQAIDSILAQTYRDFELVIFDNASTDRTGEICRGFAARDSRVRYTRNPSNVGGANNHNLTVESARGEFFRWAAHDDVLAPTLLEKCVAALDQNPDVALVFPRVIAIDENGAEQGITGVGEGTEELPSERLRSLSSRRHKCEAIYGLVRTEVLRRTELLRNYTDSDRVLLCELALRGRFLQLPEALFYKRFHAGNQYKDWRSRMAWFLPELQRSGKVAFPTWTQFFHYLRVIGHAALPLPDKLSCYASMFPWLGWNGKRMAKDIFVAAYLRLHSRAFRTRKYADSDRWA